SPRLLERHREVDAIFGLDQMVVVVPEADVDLEPVDLAGELASRVVGGHRRAVLVPEIERLVGREQERLRLRDVPATRGLTVDEETDRPTLAQTAAVVRELDSHLVHADRNRGRRLDVVLPKTEEVVTELQDPALHVQAQAATHATLRDDHTFRAAVG